MAWLILELWQSDLEPSYTDILSDKSRYENSVGYHEKEQSIVTWTNLTVIMPSKRSQISMYTLYDFTDMIHGIDEILENTN